MNDKHVIEKIIEELKEYRDCIRSDKGFVEKKHIQVNVVELLSNLDTDICEIIDKWEVRR